MICPPQPPDTGLTVMVACLAAMVGLLAGKLLSDRERGRGPPPG